MEPVITSSSSWNSSTNWAIFHGALEHSITFESSNSPIEESDVSDRKSPLVLVPSSPDSGSCDITISFAQKHEIRQIYVRSTAKVYEIYYVPSTQSSNEYLCTVRCSVASVEDLNDTSEEEELPKKCNEPSGEEKDKGASNISTSEEDWVEVKAPGSSPHNSKNSSMSSKSDNNSVNSRQELYEATAEINDAEPCTSLTLRMLSLHDKGCVYVDEIYVFGDPVDSAESDDQQGKMENSTGSSLMAMLVPTLLQLSKTGNSRIQDQNASHAIKSKVESNVADRKEVNVQEHIAAPLPDIESNSDSTLRQKDIPQSCLERSMDQLVARMSRIEDIFLRFEEKMVKPIYTIDARLQRVEQQLEILSKNTHSSGLFSGTRFTAPEFSGIESGSSSFYNDGYDNPNVGASGADTRDTSFCKVQPPCSNDICAQVNGTGVVPGLAVTAPEFSNINDDGEVYESEIAVDSPSDNPMEAELSKTDDEEIGGLEPLTDSVRDERKQAVSIDEALATALAGFLSSATINIQQSIHAFAVKAPDFSNDEDGDVAIGSPPVSPDKTECIEGVLRSPCNVASFENECATTESLKMDDFDKTNDESQKETCGGDDDDQCCVLTRSIKEGNDTSLEPVDREDSESDCEELILYHIVPTVDRHHEDILQNVRDLSCPSLVLDYEAPILDVRFNNSQENSDAISPLDALWVNTSESGDEDGPPFPDKSDDGALLVENIEAIGTTTCNDLFDAMINYEPQFINSNIEHEEFRPPHYPWNSHELPATSLI